MTSCRSLNDWLLFRTVGCCGTGPWQDLNWIGLQIKGIRSGVNAVWSRVRLLQPAPGPFQFIEGCGSYLLCIDSRLRFSVPDASLVQVTVEVDWPDGSAEHFSGLDVRRYHTVEQGTGARQDKLDTNRNGPA
jgi:hypothetical protein